MAAALKNFYLPTPKRIRIIGDSILGFTVALQPMTLGLPLSATEHVWVSFAIAFAGLVGKFITNLFTDEEAQMTPREKDIAAKNMPESGN